MPDELVEMGKVLGAVETLTGEVRSLARMMRRRMPCLQDTDPDTPGARAKLQSFTGDDEPDSVVTRAISVHAGPWFSFRGPGIIGILSFVAGALALAVSHWVHLW